MVRGLLLKELYVTRWYSLGYLLVILLHSIFMYDWGVKLWTLALPIGILGCSLAMDEGNHWDRFAAVMPCAVEKLVWCKYLSVYVYMGVVGVLLLACMAVQDYQAAGAVDWRNVLETVWTRLLGMALTAAATAPGLYRYGTKASQILTAFAIIAVICTVIKFGTTYFDGRPFVCSLPAGTAALAAVAAATYWSFQKCVSYYRDWREGACRKYSGLYSDTGYWDRWDHFVN